MAERRHEYAPAGTLPGMLQRGRGLGALMAAEDPASAAELVYGCIRWEWRWDSNTDERHLYLARLVRDLELPLGPVVEVLAGGEEACERAAGVLALLALSGSVEAREALRAYIREGEHRSDVLESVADAWPREWWGDLEEAAWDRDRDRDRGSGRREPSGPVREAERPDPMAEAASGALPGRSAEHGEERDVPALVAELERDWVDRTWCGPMQLARGLARFGPGAAGAVSLLRRFWLYTPHSHERAAYLEALAAAGSAGMPEAYTESLWDCEADVRLLGVEHAPDTPHVRARLAYLRDDPIELPEVSNAAEERLAGLS
ncbi:hypothetical protein ACFWIQ_32195 [Kitasatospora sp. NPDC127059]|uniref:hypothetical protein n=1 Tax=unclassified Kitasatospora TaxID=2633591 RepID=UPI00366422B8